jgi:hypothetical protein
MCPGRAFFFIGKFKIMEKNRDLKYQPFSNNADDFIIASLAAPLFIFAQLFCVLRMEIISC